MWTKFSPVNSANSVNIPATISEIKHFPMGYFFGALCSFPDYLLDIN